MGESTHIKQLKKEIQKGIEEGKNNNSRKTIIVKVSDLEYSNINKLIKLANRNTNNKVTKQSIIYTLLLESGALEDIKDEKDS